MKQNNILLIDDDKLSLSSFHRGLKLNGIPCDAFSDPIKAWEQFENKNYNLVLSDIMMPVMDGFQILEKIRSINSETKVFLFTGFYTEEIEKKAYKLGAEYVFKKPIEVENLIEMIKKFQ